MELREIQISQREAAPLSRSLIVSPQSPHSENFITYVAPSPKNFNEDYRYERSSPSLTDRPKHRKKAGPPKRISIVTDKLVTLGKPWKSLRLFTAQRPFLERVATRLSQPRCLQLCSFFFAASILVGITAGIIFTVAASKDNETLAMSLLVFSILTQVSTLGYLIYIIIMVCLKKAVSKDRVFCGACVRAANFLVGVLAGLCVYDYRKEYGAVVIALAYVSCCDCVTAFAILVVLLVVTLVGLLFESVVRLVICELRCPERTLCTLDYCYQPFYCDAGCFGKSRCVICLGEFAKCDEVVLLQCHHSHAFHEKCMIEWIQRSTVCPVCRKDICFLMH